MVINVWAWVYPRYCKIPECQAWKQDEERARQSSLGLWRDVEPVELWEWRKMQQARQ